MARPKQPRRLTPTSRPKPRYWPATTWRARSLSSKPEKKSSRMTMSSRFVAAKALTPLTTGMNRPSTPLNRATNRPTHRPVNSAPSSSDHGEANSDRASTSTGIHMNHAGRLWRKRQSEQLRLIVQPITSSYPVRSLPAEHPPGSFPSVGSQMFRAVWISSPSNNLVLWKSPLVSQPTHPRKDPNKPCSGSGMPSRP